MTSFHLLSFLTHSLKYCYQLKDIEIGLSSKYFYSFYDYWIDICKLQIKEKMIASPLFTPIYSIHRFFLRLQMRAILLIQIHQQVI